MFYQVGFYFLLLIVVFVVLDWYFGKRLFV